MQWYGNTLRGVMADNSFHDCNVQPGGNINHGARTDTALPGMKRRGTTDDRSTSVQIQMSPRIYILVTVAHRQV